MTYEASREVLASLNARILANVCPKVVTEEDVATYTAWLERRNALNAEGKSHGFIRIFDGTFKLNLKSFA
jgi:hypothetical protein